MTAQARGPGVNRRALQPSPTGHAQRLVVVPRRPGPIRELDLGTGRTRDELDELIDDIFGKTTEERPGPFDVALLVIGLALVAWGFLLGGPEWARWIGAVILLLGVALPARSGVRWYGRVRTTWARRRAVGDGLLLDIGHPATEVLVRAYEDLIDATELPGVADGPRTVAAAHAAVVEAASLLQGGRPEASEQVDYARRRTDAIRTLTAELLEGHRSWFDAAVARSEAEAAERREWVAAVTMAREELDSSGSVGALAEIETLTEQSRQERTDALP